MNKKLDKRIEAAGICPHGVIETYILDRVPEITLEPSKSFRLYRMNFSFKELILRNRNTPDLSVYLCVFLTYYNRDNEKLELHVHYSEGVWDAAYHKSSYGLGLIGDDFITFVLDLKYEDSTWSVVDQTADDGISLTQDVIDGILMVLNGE